MTYREQRQITKEEVLTGMVFVLLFVGHGDFTVKNLRSLQCDITPLQ